MQKLLAIIRDTFRELLIRKVLIGFLILNALALIGIAFYVNNDVYSTFAERAHVEISDEIRTQISGVIEVGVSAFFELLMIFVSIFATATVVPTMLEKGTVDLYLSKPLSRPMLLFGKVLGSVSVIGANIAVYIIGAWIILSLKLGVWNWEFLEAGAIMLFTFVVLYGIVVVFNVLTRGSAVGIIVTYVYVLIISGIVSSRELIFSKFPNTTIKSILDVAHWVLPQTKEHSAIGAQLIMHMAVTDWTPLWTCGIYAAVLYSLAGYMFSRQEF